MLRLLPLMLLALTGCESFEPLERVPQDPRAAAYVVPAPGQIELWRDGPAGVAMQWSDAGDVETGYLLERAIDDSDTFELVDTLAANRTGWYGPLPPVRSVRYRVAALRRIDGVDKRSAYVESDSLVAFPASWLSDVTVTATTDTYLSVELPQFQVPPSFVSVWMQRYADDVPSGTPKRVTLPNRFYYETVRDSFDLRAYTAYRYDVWAEIEGERVAQVQTAPFVAPPTWSEQDNFTVHVIPWYNANLLKLWIDYPRPNLETRFEVRRVSGSGEDELIRTVDGWLPSPFLELLLLERDFERAQTYRFVLVTRGGRRIEQAGASLHYCANEAVWTTNASICWHESARL